MGLSESVHGGPITKPVYFSANTRGASPTSSMQILGFGANLTHAWRVLVARILLPAPDTQGWNSHQNQGFAWGWLETDPEWKMPASAEPHVVEAPYPKGIKS
jgi:hypothetical protein